MSATKHHHHDTIEAGMRSKERPILFSSPMVNAIINQRKTQTRRVVKCPSFGYYIPNFFNDNTATGPIMANVAVPGGYETVELKCPYGNTGDTLWVRESWMPLKDGALNFYGLPFFYKADWKEGGGSNSTHGGQWKPSIHMPRAACRIMLKIIGIRVERLQDISEDDAIAEGVKTNHTDGVSDCNGEWWNYLAVDFDDFPCDSARDSFETLWRKINGTESWNNNPYVWVIKFERI